MIYNYTVHIRFYLVSPGTKPERTSSLAGQEGQSQDKEMLHLRGRENEAGIWTWTIIVYYTAGHYPILCDTNSILCYIILYCSLYLFYTYSICILVFSIHSVLYNSILCWLYQQALWGQMFFVLFMVRLRKPELSDILFQALTGFRWRIWISLRIFSNTQIAHFPAGPGCLCATGEGRLGSPGKSQDGRATANCAAAGGGFGLRMVGTCLVRFWEPYVCNYSIWN